MESDETAGRRYKVQRLIEEYDLDGVGEELERRWTAEGTERSSLRELAEDVNERVLEARLDHAGMTALDGEAENLYRLLMADAVSDGVRTEAERRLEREGIDVDRLRADFVTYQAVRTYLRRCRGAEYEPSRTNQVEGVAEDVERMVGKTDAVVEDKLRGLRDTDRITLGPFRTSTRVQVTCTDCGTRLDVGELLDSGGCGCS